VHLVRRGKGDAETAMDAKLPSAVFATFV